MRAALYVRVSTVRQVRKADSSLETQRELLTAYAHQRGWSVVEVYEDAGLSAKDLDRPNLQRLLRDLEAGRFDVVPTYKYDRISRSTRDLLELIERFARAGVDFVSTTQQLDTSTPQGKFMLTILVGMAQFEREMTADRTRDKMYHRAAAGKWNGGTVPFGYMVDKAKALVPHPRDAVQVQRAFELYRSHRSTLQVAKLLQAEFPKGRAWTTGNLAGVLRNRVYTGKLVYAGEIHEGQHEALVDAPTFEAVQEHLEQNRLNRGRQGRATTHGLAVHRVARCACGEPMRIVTAWGGSGERRFRYHYARCRHARGNAAGVRCEVPQIQGKKLEDAVMALVEQACQDPVLIQEAMRKLAEQSRRRIDQKQTYLEGLRGERDEARARLRRLLDHFGDSESRAARQEIEELAQKVDALDREIGQLDTLRPPPPATRGYVARVQRSLDVFRRAYQAMTVGERGELFLLVLEAVVWHGEYLTVKFHGNPHLTRIPLIDGELRVDQALEVPAGMWLESPPVRGELVCCEAGCTEAVHAKGYCRLHYQRAARAAAASAAGADTPARSKLTEQDVADIRRLVAEGRARQVDLARAYGVSRARICLIVKKGG